MNKKYFVFFVGTIGIALFAQFDIGRRLENIKLAKLIKSQHSGPTVAASLVPAAPVVVSPPVEPPEVFIKRFKTEAQQIGKLQNNPQAVQDRLKVLANRMNPKDVAGLFDIISSEKSDADQRALAVELLSIKNDTTSLRALQNFVANTKTVDGAKWDQKKEFETV